MPYTLRIPRLQSCGVVDELEESEIEEVVETEEIIEDVSEKVSEMELEAE